MERVMLDKSLGLSRIVYGMWRLADDEDRSPRNVQAKIEACLEQGITSFDQADIYGNYESEEVLGAALKEMPSLRSQMEIITKCDILLLSEKYPERRVKYYDTGAEHIISSVDASLQKMGIEQIDLLLLHRPDPLMCHYETGGILDGLVKEGKVRAVGVSNFRPWDWSLLQAAMNPLVTNQIELSLLARDPLTNGDLAFFQENVVPVMAWSPLGGGALFDPGRTDLSQLREALERVGAEYDVGIDAVALAWLLRHPANIMPVVGTNNLSRISRLSDAMRVEIDRQTWFELYTLAMGHEVP